MLNRRKKKGITGKFKLYLKCEKPEYEKIVLNFNNHPF